ncbi:hypothetical protein CW368_10830 [Actinomycetales bacterium SN12]|nr:hypothetical protein CW368_10830 [Actinomycetales bacterium SN12]
MQLDVYTVNVIVAVAALTAAVMYLLETLLRQESRAGQLWALSYLCGILTVTAYLVWMGGDRHLVPIAVGNGALVGTIGCLWLGCLRHNGRRLLRPSLLVAAAALVVTAAVFLDGGAGDWAGAAVTFASVAVFAVLGAVESRRGRNGDTPETIGLTVVLAVAGLYYGARCGVLVVSGPESEVFRTWFDSSVTGLLTIVLLIVALVTTTTLRNNAVVFGEGSNELNLSGDGVLSARSFFVMVQRIVEVDREDERTVGVIAFRADDLPQIGIAFGASEQEAVLALCRQSLRRYAPAMSPIGELGPNGLAVAVEADSPSAVRRMASRIQRRMLDDLADRGTAVIPVIGLGVAIADTYGKDARALIRAAFDAAGRAATSLDASVVIAD